MRKPQINPNEILNPKNAQLDELEKLVEMGINIVRDTKGLKPLKHHKVLYDAAADHNCYQAQNNVIGHVLERKGKEDPMIRVNAHGGGFSLVMENLLYFGFATNTTTLMGIPTKKEIQTESYGFWAKRMVSGWVNSPGHYKNIIHTEATHFGTSIDIDPKGEKIYATQVFGMFAITNNALRINF